MTEQKMTKDDYKSLLLKTLAILKMERANRVLEDILFALLSMPTEDEDMANNLYNAIKGYYNAVSVVEPFPTSQLMSKALYYSMKLAEYHKGKGDKAYEEALCLLDCGENESNILWSSCDKGYNMLNEQLVPSNHYEGKLTVSYSLKTEDIDFDYDIEEER